MIQAQQYTSEAEMRQAYIARINRLRNPKLKPANVNKPEPEDPVIVKVYDIKGMPVWKKAETWFDYHVRAFKAFNSPDGKAKLHRFIARRAHDLGFSYSKIRSVSRTKELVLARHQIIWEVRNIVKPGMSFPELGRLMNMDHSSVHHACRRIQNLVDRGEIETIEGLIE